MTVNNSNPKHPLSFRILEQCYLPQYKQQLYKNYSGRNSDLDKMLHILVDLKLLEKNTEIKMTNRISTRRTYYHRTATGSIVLDNFLKKKL